MRKTFEVSRLPVSVGFACVLASAVLAGDLNPPVGVVAPTPGPEPRIVINAVNTPGDADATPSMFKITQPGSYYLAGNVMGQSGKIGIEIASSGVTIDLMGFELLGVPGSLEGVRATVLSKSVAIRNGSVRSWGGSGVHLGMSSGAQLENIRSIGNGNHGINLNSNSTIVGCTATENAQIGIIAGSQVVIDRCVSSSNGNEGILVSTTGVVRSCSIFFNTSHGLEVGSYTVVEGCTVNNNLGDGIRCNAQTRIVGNVCAVNTNGVGIHLMLPANHVENNYVTGNGIGIKNEPGSGSNFIVRNTARSNTTNYSITGTQTVGPIITATGTIATTSPFANFEM
ncbi:MAG TPA: right-handed parallel beta-helix repeat-containing protein [Phycisphaerales bacterium]|nr:right-handed parallel beta-helix repeat-containing protein [Phycisphaerales bacterium]